MALIVGVDIGITRAAPCALTVYDTHLDSVLEIATFAPVRTGVDERIGEIARAIDTHLTGMGERGLIPIALAYEMSHFQLNPQTALKLAKMCGAIVAVGSMLELFIYEIQPAQGKLALAGYDKADKAAMIKAAALQYGRAGLTSHEADSIGIALAGAAIYKREAMLERAS